MCTLFISSTLVGKASRGLVITFSGICMIVTMLERWVNKYLTTGCLSSNLAISRIFNDVTKTLIYDKNNRQLQSARSKSSCFNGKSQTFISRPWYGLSTTCRCCEPLSHSNCFAGRYNQSRRLNCTPPPPLQFHTIPPSPSVDLLLQPNYLLPQNTISWTTLIT